MKNLTDVVKYYLMKEYEISDLSISGTSLMMKLRLTYDDLYDFASESFYPLDAFIIEVKPELAKKFKTKIFIDESIWFKNSSDEDPLHEQNGLKIIYDDCKVVMLSSGLTLQNEGYAFKDLMDLLITLSKGSEIKLSIPYILDEYYVIVIKDGKVEKSEIDLSMISMKEARLGLYQVIMFAGKNSIQETLELID